MQGARLRQQALALFQQVGDVLATERLELAGVLDGAGRLVRAVDFTQSHDLADVVQDIQTPLLQFLVEGLGFRREGQQAHEQLLILGLAALLQEFAGMVRVFKVAVAVVAAHVAGDQFLLVVEAELVGVELQTQARASVFGGHGVSVGVQGDAELAVGAHRLDDAHIVGQRRQGPQTRLFLLKEFERLLLGGAVEPHVGDGVQPLSSRGIEQAEVGELLSGQKVLLDVTHGVFDAAFFIRFSNSARSYFAAEVIREVLVARIEDRGFADDTLEHGRLQIVNHELCRNGVEVFEGVLMTGQKMFHRLGERELDIQHAAVAEHHDKEAQAPLRIADRDGTKLPPIHLGVFAGRESECQERRRVWWPDVVHVILDDGNAAAVAALAQAQEDLCGGVGMSLQPADDLRLEGIELAGLPDDFARTELAHAQPLGDGAFIQGQFPRDLRDGQVPVLLVVLDLAVQFVINHLARSRP